MNRYAIGLRDIRCRQVLVVGNFGKLPISVRSEIEVNRFAQLRIVYKSTTIHICTQVKAFTYTDFPAIGRFTNDEHILCPCFHSYRHERKQ